MASLQRRDVPHAGKPVPSASGMIVRMRSRSITTLLSALAFAIAGCGSEEDAPQPPEGAPAAPAASAPPPACDGDRRALEDYAAEITDSGSVEIAYSASGSAPPCQVRLAGQPGDYSLELLVADPPRQTKDLRAWCAIAELPVGGEEISLPQSQAGPAKGAPAGCVEVPVATAE